MKNSKLLALGMFAVILFGCAAGMVGVHKGNIAAGEAGLHSLGPENEDTPEEARKRIRFNEMIEEAKSKLHEIAEKERNSQ